MEWNSPGSPVQEKFFGEIECEDDGCFVFYDITLVVHLELLSANQTVNFGFHLQVLNWLRKSLSCSKTTVFVFSFTTILSHIRLSDWPVFHQYEHLDPVVLFAGTISMRHFISQQTQMHYHGRTKWYKKRLV